MKQSAGLLLFRKKNGGVEVLLGHPGGPFWAKKDAGAWSIPKGEFEPNEEAADAAKREFTEETGLDVPEGEVIELGSVKASSSKTIYAWAIEADVDPKHVKGNMFEMEWPPKSGQKQEFPEIDKAAWFPLAKAKLKITKGQIPILQKLADAIGADMNAEPSSPARKTSVASEGQTSLF